jgi:hypothetical protein
MPLLPFPWHRNDLTDLQIEKVRRVRRAYYADSIRTACRPADRDDLPVNTNCSLIRGDEHAFHRDFQADGDRAPERFSNRFCP